MKNTKTYAFSVRLTPDDKVILDSIIKAKACTRTEAVRLALKIGGPFLEANVSINLNRVLMLLEILLAECIERVDRRDPAKVGELLQIASERVEQYHAQK